MASSPTPPPIPSSWQDPKKRAEIIARLKDAMTNLSQATDGPSEWCKAHRGFERVKGNGIPDKELDHLAEQLFDLVIALHTQGPLLEEAQLMSHREHPGDALLCPPERINKIVLLLQHYKRAAADAWNGGNQGRGAPEPKVRADLLKRRIVSQPQTLYRDFRHAETTRKNARRVAGNKAASPERYKPEKTLGELLAPTRKKGGDETWSKLVQGSDSRKEAVQAEPAVALKDANGKVAPMKRPLRKLAAKPGIPAE